MEMFPEPLIVDTDQLTGNAVVPEMEELSVKLELSHVKIVSFVIVFP